MWSFAYSDFKEAYPGSLHWLKAQLNNWRPGPQGGGISNSGGIESVGLYTIPPAVPLGVMTGSASSSSVQQEGQDNSQGPQAHVSAQSSRQMRSHSKRSLGSVCTRENTPELWERLKLVYPPAMERYSKRFEQNMH
jgi:hypothetical protein